MKDEMKKHEMKHKNIIVELDDEFAPVLLLSTFLDFQGDNNIRLTKIDGCWFKIKASKPVNQKAEIHIIINVKQIKNDSSYHKLYRISIKFY